MASNDARESTLTDFGVQADTHEDRVECPNCGHPIPENQKATHYAEDCPDVDTRVRY